MTKSPKHTPQTETTPEGTQALAPVSLRERLDVMARQALRGKRGTPPQKPCDIGLFDEAARAQLDQIDRLRSPENGQSTQLTPTGKE